MDIKGLWNQHWLTELASWRLFRPKVSSWFCHDNNGQTNWLFSWEPILVTNFVTRFLIASSVAVSFFFLKNPIAKVLEHDGAFAMVRNFKLETLSYIAGSYYNTVLLNLPAWTLSHVFTVLTVEGFRFSSPYNLVAGHGFLLMTFPLKKDVH